MAPPPTYIIFHYYCKKVKRSHYKPGQTLRVPEGWGSQISRQSAHESVKVVSPTHRPHLPPRKYSWYSFLLEAESIPGAIVRPEGLCQWKIPLTPSGIEPAPFRLAAQCLKPAAPPRAPHYYCSWLKFILYLVVSFNLIFLELQVGFCPFTRRSTYSSGFAKG